MREWTETTLGDIVSEVTDRVRPSDAKDLPYLGLEHFNSGGGILAWGRSADVTSMKTKFVDGDVLYGKLRPYLRKSAWADREGVCSTDVLVLRAKPGKVLPSYLAVLVASEMVHAAAMSSSAGTRMPRTSFRALASTRLVIPPPPEQRRIVDLVWHMEAVAKASQSLSQSAERALTRVRDQLFLSGPEVTLNDLLDDIDAGKSPLAEDRLPLPGERCVLKVSAVSRNGFRPDQVKVVPAAIDLPSKSGVSAGDLLITRANTAELVGSACIVEDVPDEFYLSDKTLRLTPKDGIDRRILWHLLCSPPVLRQLTSAGTGTSASMKNISQAKLLQVRLPRIPVGVVSPLASLADALYDVARAATSEVAATQALKSQIVNAVVCGERQIPESYDDLLGDAA